MKTLAANLSVKIGGVKKEVKSKVPFGLIHCLPDNNNKTKKLTI